MANQKTWMILFAMLLVLDLNQQPFVIGWALFPVHYTFNIENALRKDILGIHCISNTNEGDLGIAHIPLHGNYTHRFKTALAKTVTYTCTLTVPGRAFKVLPVFIDAQKFIDDQCGGRHCFWKVQDDGVYLYQIHKNQYIKRYDWDHA